jgi:uncharacterized membrane protein
MYIIFGAIAFFIIIIFFAVIIVPFEMKLKHQADSQAIFFIPSHENTTFVLLSPFVNFLSDLRKTFTLLPFLLAPSKVILPSQSHIIAAPSIFVMIIAVSFLCFQFTVL